VVVKNVKVSEDVSYPKIYLVADGLSVGVKHTVDGLEFDLVAVNSVLCDAGNPGA
jgi:ribosome-binding factor A